MKVYLVSTGSYSDYSVRAICSTKEKAEIVRQAIAKGYSYDDANDIQEFELDEVFDIIDRGMSIWMVAWRGDYENVRADKFSPDFGAEGIRETHCGPKAYTILVEARDEDHAKKIALEKWIVYKASI